MNRRARLTSGWGTWGALGVLGLGIALPVVAQRAPTSLLPPGFGSDEPAAPAAAPTGPASSRPAEQSGQAPAARAPVRPALNLDLSGIGGPGPSAAAPPGASDGDLAEANALSPEEEAAQKAKYDLPDGARRALTRIGPLTQLSGGVAEDAFGRTSGKMLVALMRAERAPFVSRWGSILLRRVLLSATATPDDIDGADWAAERAWLLLRMGEADAARMMVQSVDSDRFTPRLYAVAMQAYLATGDLAGLCPLYAGAQKHAAKPGWLMASAICASFTREQGTASSVLNQVARRGTVTGIDYRLGEKAVGAGINARRSVKIEWDGVDRLTAWRFGLATALNVDIPAPLLAAAGPRVLAWQARAPALSLPMRRPAVETAARLGVFSSAALVDYYGALAGSGAEDFTARATTIADSYRGATVGTRIAAMRQIWGGAAVADYVGLLTVARAAAVLPVTDAQAGDAGNLVAAMLSAGYDRSAARWARAVGQGDNSETALAWALLAVGAPDRVVGMSADMVSTFAQGNGRRGQMLVAGIAGLGRLDGRQANEIAGKAGVPLARRTRWSDAIAAAAARGERGTVALLAAVGMQTSDWSGMPPAYLYHIVAALHRVGLDPEARMIAAEAVMRS